MRLAKALLVAGLGISNSLPMLGQTTARADRYSNGYICTVIGYPTATCPAGTSNGVTTSSSASASGRTFTGSGSVSGIEVNAFGNEVGQGIVARQDYLNLYGPTTPTQVVFYYRIQQAGSASTSNQDTQALGGALALFHFGDVNVDQQSAEDVYYATASVYGQATTHTRTANITQHGSLFAATFSYLRPVTAFDIIALGYGQIVDPTNQSAPPLLSGDATGWVELTFAGVDALDANGASLSDVDGCSFASGEVCHLAEITTAPEPSSFAFLATGLLALSGMGHTLRTRKKLRS